MAEKQQSPEYYPEAQVKCACGNNFTVGSTQPKLEVELCAQCHPFFTGEQRFVDTTGQVEKFQRRVEQAKERQQDK